MNEGVHAYCLLLEIDVDQSKLLGGKSLCFNLNPAKPSQNFFLTMRGMNESGKGLVLYFLTSLTSLVPYCLTIYVYSAFFMDNKNVGVNQVIALKEEPSFSCSCVKVQH